MSEQNQNYTTEEIMSIIGAASLAARQWDEMVTSGTVSFPLSELMSLGTAFSSISSSFKKLSDTAKHSGTLYEAVFPVKGKLASAKDGSGLLGTIINKKGIAGQARFKEVGQTAKAASGIGAVFMAMAIMAINQSLKNISENQKAIIGFLDADKQTKLKGDLNTLSDIINDYQFNWDNSQWLSNREIQVLDIKRSGEQNILFYREMIEKKLGSKNRVVRFDASNSLNEIQGRFKYYKLALYLYSFSSFLDIILLKNFDSKYLEAIRTKIETYALEYSDFFEKSYEGIEQIAVSSVQARTMQGLSAAGKFVGKQIAKIPDKGNKIKIDDKMIAGSDKLEDIKSKAVEETKTALSSVRDPGVRMFSDKIELIDKMYNEPLKIYVDAENIYLVSE